MLTCRDYHNCALLIIRPSHRVPGVYDGKLISAIIFVIHNGMRWRDGGEDERRSPFEGALDRGQPFKKGLFFGILDAPKAT